MGINCSVFRTLYCRQEVRILIQGLDAAGKTSVLYKLKLGEVVTTIPTIGFNVETLQINNINITAWDVGGRDKIRPLWRHYYQNTDALVLVVDSNDRERIGEVKDELDRMLAEDELRDAILLVLANKQDLPGALTALEVTDKLGLTAIRQRTWNLIPTKALSGEGLYEAFGWLADEMKKKRGIYTPPNDTTTSRWSSMWTKATGFYKTITLR